MQENGGFASGPAAGKKSASGALVPFFIFLVIYLAVNLLDGSAAWYMAFRQMGLLNTVLHQIFTLGGGVSHPLDFYRQNPQFMRYAMAFPGVLMSIPAFLSILLCANGKQAAGAVFAGLNLLLSLVLAAVMASMCVPVGLAWLPYVLSSVLLLASAASGKDSVALFVVAFVPVLLSIFATLALSLFNFNPIHGELKYMGFRYWQMKNGLDRMFGGYQCLITGQYISSNFMPFSRAAMLLCMAFGIRAAGKGAALS